MVELLTLGAVAAVLLSVLLPIVSSVRQQTKGLECASHLKTIVTEFQFFAMGDSPGNPAETDGSAVKHLRIDTFQEKLYGIDGYWDLPSRDSGELTPGSSLMLCPAGKGTLIKHHGYPCGPEAVAPPQNVSLAFNMRLRQAGSIGTGWGGHPLSNAQAAKKRANPGKSVPTLTSISDTHLRSDINDHPSVPLVMDVDGVEAVRRGIEPFYIAPPICDRDDPYIDGRYWTPSKRHHGRTQVGFVGGHVLSSEHPEWEPWDWGYEASTEP